MLCTQELIKSVIDINKTKKFVFTGAASSVIGDIPNKQKGFIYDDPLVWAD